MDQSNMAEKTPATRFSKAPITEAIIDIHFTGPDHDPIELAGLQKPEKNSYPGKKPIFAASVVLDSTQPDTSPKITTQNNLRLGWAFVAADKLQVWQVRKGGFTFSRLAPYQSWEPFRNEARRLWQLSKGFLAPKEITRIAVRYINRLELPLPLRDFKDYLLTVPEVSPKLPQGLLTYFMQLQIPQDDIKCLLVLNQQLVPPNPSEALSAITASVILDIDLFRTHQLPQDENGIWDYFELLHQKKNDIFLGCITDLTRELIR